MSRAAFGIRCTPLLLTCVMLTAQQTWIVDGNGGGHFTDIGSALASASDGDTIEVRPFSSSYFLDASTNKGVTLIGDAGTPPRLNGQLTVSGLPRGQRFVLGSFLAQGPSTGREILRINDCTGSVVVDRLSFPNPSPQVFACAISVTHSSSVSVHAPDISGWPALESYYSNVAISGGQLRGGSDAGVLPQALFGTAPAIRAHGSRIFVDDTECRGGDGYSILRYPPPLPPIWDTFSPSPAIDMTDSYVTVTGACGIVGGWAAGQSYPSAGIRTGLGALLHSPSVRIDGPPTIVSRSAVRMLPMPSLSAIGDAPGGTVQVAAHAEPSALVAILVSLPTIPWGSPFGDEISPFGDMWIDPWNCALLHVSVAPPTGVVQASIPVSPLCPPALPWTLQAVQVGGSNPPLPSGPVTVLLR